jgi:hypothetical protein
MKISIKENYYYGYKQGVKVYIDGKKYPLKRGYVYSEYKDNNKAIKQALKDNYNINIKFSKNYLWSPKEYNFATDEIIADINKPYTLIDTFRTNKDFLEYLKDSKSYDGYISNYSYDSALNNKNDILPVYILSYIFDKWQESENYYCNLADSIYIDIIEKEPCNA